MTTLTRKQAMAALKSAGWDAYLFDTMIAIGAQESSLRVDVTGPSNPNGTCDYGWLQINSMYVAGSPNYNKALLLSDPVYCARAGLDIYKRQGLKAWVAYTSGDYKKFMPPPTGPTLTLGAVAWFLVADVQAALNTAGASPPLKVDGQFGPKTQEAVVAYQSRHPVEPRVVGPVYWRMLVP